MLAGERQEKLESIGFKWVIMEQKPKDYTKKDLHWIHQYNALVQFQKQVSIWLIVRCLIVIALLPCLVCSPVVIDLVA